MKATFSIRFSHEGTCLPMVLKQSELVDELKVEWKRLWRERYDDRVRAEGIALDDYNVLFVEKGTIIHATRDFKTLSFKDILDKHAIQNAERYIPPDPQVGGWTKFVKNNIKPQSRQEKFLVDCGDQKMERQLQQKQNGRGWLHR
ncbi:MAG: hypothetical protein NWE93_12000 [Candidatus Bathyarchaeota archaeon]|nr:hypothetical protein [Candidatus Bathyarchaeota archaeon]